jgi:biopolymer transport protein ExbD
MNLRGRNKVSPEFSMSSMTDIVFLLLVFFMLTSPVITPEALDYYVNDEQVNKNQLESVLKVKLKGIEDPTIILRAAEGVPIENAVNVMDIANKNRFKIILAVKPK